MGRQRGAHVIGRIRPLHTGVHSFRVLAKNGGVDLRLFEAAVHLLANVVERIARKTDTRPDADIQVELLPHVHNRAVVDIAFAAQLGIEFSLSFFIRLRRDRAEKAELVLGEQIDGPVGKRIAFAPPELPADIAVHVLGANQFSQEVRQIAILGEARQL